MWLRLGQIPSKEVESISVAFGHVPQFSKRKLVGKCSAILAENILKIYRGVSEKFRPLIVNAILYSFKD